MKTYEYADDTNNAIIVTDGDTVMTVPVDPENRHYAEIIASGVEIAPYVAPPPPVPSSCGPAQAKIVLWEMGLLDQVEAMVNAHPYRPVSIWYNAATVWERSHPYVTALAYEFELTDEQIDDLFALAVTK
jgi:hypothetical protein